jgi:hypothetical protein
MIVSFHPRTPGERCLTPVVCPNGQLFELTNGRWIAAPVERVRWRVGPLEIFWAPSRAPGVATEARRFSSAAAVLQVGFRARPEIGLTTGLLSDSSPPDFPSS